MRIASEFERASPRRSEGKPVVKSLKEESSGPREIGVWWFSGVGVSWFRRTERMAWVPQAFWIVWFAKKKFSGTLVAGTPSCLWVLLVAGARRYLKRKMTP